MNKNTPFLLFLFIIMSCSSPQEVKPNADVKEGSQPPLLTSTPSPDENHTNNGKVNQPSLLFSKTTFCFNQKVEVVGTYLRSNHKYRLIFQHPITRERDENENPERYIILDSIVSDQDGRISSSFILKNSYPSDINQKNVILHPGKYIAVIESQNRNFDDSLQIEVCPTTTQSGVVA